MATSQEYSTSSALARDEACPPNGTLPRTDEAILAADVGNAKHDHLEARAKLGVDEAMRLVPEHATKWRLDDRESFFFGVWAKKFEWSPPPNSLGEVSLALLDDGTVERTTGGKGRYPELEPGGRLYGRAILAGQTDVMWSEGVPLDLSDPARPRAVKGGVLYVGDYKGGTDAHVDPIEVNLQVAANAVMAAKWTGAKFVAPFVLFLTPPNGEWDAPEVAWGPKELAAAEVRVRAVLQRRRDLIARALAGDAIDGWREGPWCTFCPGKLSCPAKVAMLRHTAQLAVAKAPLELTDDEAAWWALRLSQIESMTKRAREYLKGRVDAKGPIQLGNGLVWGPQESVRNRILPNVAIPIIEAEIGKDKLDDVAKISREAIEDAVRAEHAARGIKRQLSKAMGKIMARIKEAGGIESDPHVQYGVHRPKTGPETDEGTEPAQLGDGEEAAAQ